MELTHGPNAALSLPQALGGALATAALTGLFALALMPIVMVIADPTELRSLSRDDLPGLIAFFSIGALWAVPTAIVVAWLPIAAVGWTLRRAALRWAKLANRWVYCAVGALCGGIVNVVLDPGRQRFEPGILAYFCTVGIFAALVFRRLTRGVTTTTRQD